MAITRTFLDWSQSALHSVVDYLTARFERGQHLDLESVLLVLPGGRAGRRLNELLASHCANHSLLLIPPEYCTVGLLPEYLYESHLPFASDLTQQLAWVRALQDVDQVRCRRFIPRLPDQDEYAHWMDLGRLLQSQHRELAADALNFANTARLGTQLNDFNDQDRWLFMAEIQQRYLEILDELKLWDRQTARLYAIEHSLCETDKDIILVGTTDMNIATHRMLDQVAREVTALVFAPTALADRFDSHGCLDCDKWVDATLAITSDQIRVVEGPADQAREMVRALGDLKGQYRADQVVIGVLDEALVPQLMRQLEEVDIAARWVVGRTVRETAPYRLLEAAGRCTDGNRFRDLAAFARHPDVSQWLSARLQTDKWLIDLDRYYCDHLPPNLDEWLEQSPQATTLKQLTSLLQDATAMIQGPARPLGEWTPGIAQVLTAFYGDRTFDTHLAGDRYTLGALEKIRASAIHCQQIPSDIAPTLSASRAIQQLLVMTASEQIPSPLEDGQIELLGWLELPLDPAPVLIATGFNEGNVPTSVNSDLFLPNRLRRQLDLLDNRRRYARDAYALSLLQASRTSLTLIAGRHSADHDPLAPSRLAFATDDDQVVERALSFFTREPSDDSGQYQIVTDAPSEDDTSIVVPRPQPLETPITSLSVTSFRSYLQCPYRFYLQHVLRLETVDDTAAELGPAAFGTLIHEVLKQFGQSDLCNSTDSDKINRFLQRTLDRCIKHQWGTRHLPAVDVQLVQARSRLNSFATWQSRWAAEGWEIAFTETSGGDEPPKLSIGAGQSITLKGRIDRIDRRGDEWTLFDYKTSDAAKTPQETHRRSDSWIDLQLPLYIPLAKSLGIKGALKLGYIVLPKNAEKTGALFADWNDDMLANAQTEARRVASDIVAEKFWPPQRLPTRILTDFASICQEHAFRPHLEKSISQ